MLLHGLESDGEENGGVSSAPVSYQVLEMPHNAMEAMSSVPIH